MNKIFISYNHCQAQWVNDDLLPCLKYGGAEVLIDKQEFTVGRSVKGQMDTVQDQADLTVAVLCNEYLTSDYCMHELERAVDRDQEFNHGLVVPVMVERCSPPDSLQGFHEPLWVNLVGDRRHPAAWEMLMKGCGARLGVPAINWLRCRDELKRYLERGYSVNLVTRGTPVWRNLLDHVREDIFPEFGMIDVQSPMVANRRALVEEILAQCGSPMAVKSTDNDDLVTLGRVLNQKSFCSRLIIQHFDDVTYKPYYDNNLFGGLRNLVSDMRKLNLLIQSHKPFIEFLPENHPFSEMGNVFKLLELRG